MRNRIFALFVVILGIIGTFVDCSNKAVSGQYVSEKNSRNYIELDSDGTFFLQEGKIGSTGKYEIKGDRITLKSDTGLASRGTIEGKSIIDKDGDRWTKQDLSEAEVARQPETEKVFPAASPEETVKVAFSLTEQDKIEIFGISEETKTTRLVKFSVNEKQASGRMRKYDQGWQLDEIQDELGAWLPVSAIIKQVEESVHILGEKAQRQWIQVKSAYQRRADLVPNLIETAIEASNSEKPTLTAVIDARVAASQVKLTADNMNAETFAQFQKAQDDLSSALARLLVVIEKYPNIRGNSIFRELLAQLEGTENRLTVERMSYNQAAAEYNSNISKTMVFLLGVRFSGMPIFKASKGSVPPPPVRF